MNHRHEIHDFYFHLWRNREKKIKNHLDAVTTAFFDLFIFNVIFQWVPISLGRNNILDINIERRIGSANSIYIIILQMKKTCATGMRNVRICQYIIFWFSKKQKSLSLKIPFNHMIHGLIFKFRSLFLCLSNIIHFSCRISTIKIEICITKQMCATTTVLAFIRFTRPYISWFACTLLRIHDKNEIT